MIQAGKNIMIRKLVVSLTASWMIVAGLPTDARAEQPPPPSPELVKEIQSRLFDLGYVAWPDGKWDDRTQTAIKNWHQDTNRPISNVMSDDDVAYLRTAKPHRIWGGVVYDSKGRYRLFTNEASRKELVNKEISYCQQGFEPKQCRLDLILNTTMADTVCIGISHAEWKEGQTTHSSSSTARRVNIKLASDDAVNECARTNPRDACKLLAAVCADGSGQNGALESK
jgi:hypothetical protein